MDAWEQMKREFVEKVTPLVIEEIRREMTQVFKDNFKFCYSEEEASEILGFKSVKTLRRERDAGAISYSTFRGKTVYQPHHILNYLKRNEVVNGKQSVTLEDVLGTSKKVLDFPKAA